MEKIKGFFLRNKNTKQTIIKNTFWLLVSELGMKVLKLVLFIYATKQLSVSEWGLFSYMLALMGFFSVVSDIGINSVLLRETAKQNIDEKKYISTGLSLKFGLALISSLALISLMLFLDKDSTARSLLPITALLLFIDAIREFGFSLNRALEKMEVEALVRIATTILLVWLGFKFTTTKPEAMSLLYAYVLSSLAGVILMYLSLRQILTGISKNFQKGLLYPIWKEAWPLGIATTIGTIMASTDIVILGFFESSKEIGVYSTAQKMTQVLYLLPGLISAAILPALSRLAKGNEGRVRSITSRVVKGSLIFTLPLVAMSFLFGDKLFLNVFGETYIDSIIIFKIMSIAIIALVPASIVSSAFFAKGYQKDLIRFIAISFTTNIFLCLVLIPKLGNLGAAIAVTVAYTLGNGLLIQRFYKKNKLNLNHE